MFQLPLIARKELQIRLDILHRKPAVWPVGIDHGPEDGAAPETKGFDLELEFRESAIIELDLNLRGGDLRSAAFSRLTEANVFGNNALIPAPAEAGELEIDAAGPQFIENGFFYKAGETDLIQIDDAGEKQQEDQPDRDAKTAKVNPAQTPEFALLALGHFRGCLRRSRG